MAYAGRIICALVQARYGLQYFFLNLDRQAGRQAVDIDFLVAHPLRFQVKMVPFLVGELDDLVFDRRAIAGADALDFSRIQWRQMQMIADDRSDRRGRIAQMAEDPVLYFAFAEHGKRQGRFITGLGNESFPFDAVGMQPHRRPGFQAQDSKPQGGYIFSQKLGRRLIGPAGGV